MLSILIPIFNYSVKELVLSIHEQCYNLGISFEILLLDDYSTNRELAKANKKLTSLKFVTYIQNEKNMGNASSRVKLSEQAIYPWLLFLDADVLPVHNTFILNYLQEIKEEHYSVLAGNIVYKKELIKPEFRLKVKHGRKHEHLPKRFDKHSPIGLRGANFAIRKNVFSSDYFLPLPNSYGYVDTVFGIILHQKNIHTKLINNPVYHLGLETSTSFLNKTKLAVENCNFLLNNYPQIASHLRLAQFYKKIKLLKLNFLFSKLFKQFHPLLLKNLNSSNPSLYAFQMYKIGYLCSL